MIYTKNKPLSLKATKSGWSGFTLLELMMTLVLLSILLALGVPSMRTIILNNRTTGISNELFSSLVMARSEAIKRNQEVSITAISTVSGNEWGDGGWRIWIDDNGNGSYDAGSDTLIRQIAATSDTFLINSVDDSVDFTFAATGLASGFAGVSPTETFMVRPVSGCPESGNDSIKGKVISLSASGRAALTTCSCNSSLVEHCN
jgi:type IV fimbrial biogenesis protein FimT